MAERRSRRSSTRKTTSKPNEDAEAAKKAGGSIVEGEATDQERTQAPYVEDTNEIYAETIEEEKSAKKRKRAPSGKRLVVANNFSLSFPRKDGTRVNLTAGTTNIRDSDLIKEIMNHPTGKMYLAKGDLRIEDDTKEGTENDLGFVVQDEKDVDAAPIGELEKDNSGNYQTKYTKGSNKSGLNKKSDVSEGFTTGAKELDSKTLPSDWKDMKSS